MTEIVNKTGLIHEEAGMTFIWAGGHVPIEVWFGDTEIGLINMSRELPDRGLEDVVGTLEQHMKLFRSICGVFIGERLSGEKFD
jgi:hypothetical protein